MALSGLLLLTLVGCTATDDAPQTTTAELPPTAEVELRDISSVVVVAGDVMTNPHYLVSSPVAGRLSYTVGKTKTLDAGTEIARVGGTSISTLAEGQIVEWLRDSGEAVSINSPVAELSYSGFGIPVVVPAQLLYRIYGPLPVEAKANITGGPAGITCTLVAVSLGGETQAVPDDGYRPSICLLPLDTEVVAALPAKVGVPTASALGVLALPVSAVSGSANSGEVTLVESGGTRRINVTLGISDGAYVEIVSGLSLGDTVIARAPGIQ